MQTQWTCHWCSKTFGKKEHVLRHERTHTEAKPYECFVCKQEFGRQDVLVRHIKGKHPHSPIHKSSLKKRAESNSRTGLKTSNGIVSQTLLQGQLESAPQLTSDEHVNQPLPTDLKSPPSAALLLPHDSSDSFGGHSAFALEPHQPIESSHTLLGDQPAGQGGESSSFSDDASSLFAFSSPSSFDFTTLLPATTAPVEFDLDAMLEAFLATPAHDVAPPTFSDPDAAAVSLTSRPPDSTSTQHWYLISNAWPTHYESSQTSAPSMKAPQIDVEGSHIDDSIVEALQEGLQSQPDPSNFDSELLLESDFLRAALDCFWSCVYPSFPIVHQATFRPKRYPLLTLSLVCIGAVYIGTAKSRHISTELYHRVKHQVIMRSVDVRSSSREPGDDLAVLQASFFGQLYGSLCGNALALHTSRMYSTPLSNFARNLLLASDRKTENGAIWSVGQWDNETWALWIEAECVKRAVYGLIWQSAYLSSVMPGPTPYHLQIMRLAWPGPEAAFTATSASEAHLLTLLHSEGPEATSTPKPTYWHIVTSLLSGRYDAAAYSTALEPGNEQKSAAVLNGLAVAIHALPGGIWGNYPNDGARLAARKALLLWYEGHVQSEGRQARQDPLMRMETFHLAFLHLMVPFEIIELACGKEGPQVSCEPWLIEHLTVWAATPFARLALLHAGQIWALLDLSHRRKPGGLLLPTAAIHAALIIWTFQRFSTPMPATEGSRLSIELTDQFDWLALEDEDNPKEVNARAFLKGSGQCTLGGVRCDYQDPSHPCSTFAAQLVGTSCWGQTQQSIALLNLLALPLSTKI